jgi:hypothetical protein
MKKKFLYSWWPANIIFLVVPLPVDIMLSKNHSKKPIVNNKFFLKKKKKELNTGLKL